ncbi:MAG TPA: tRNA pseudouridine(55) synthase TruB [Streptosporangiaceae bacterium]|nr:tRNA pseudouridine(55) synthase TruB [Streptosporangiaceae bacterium]
MTPAASGLVIVDKPSGWTSHDVVAQIRRLAGTRRVGHAGTLDPMATGVLVVGVEKATRLLGHLTLAEKAYTGTMRLGQATSTDDAEGEIVSAAGAGHLTTGEIRAAAAALTGEIRQVPPQVSAVKVAGERAYRVARSGRVAPLRARDVTVRVFDVAAIRRATAAAAPVIDADVSVTCSSGTYIRSLARDLGAALGVGGHLVALRRIRSGRYDIAGARTLDQLAASFTVLPLADAAAAEFPRREVTGQEAERVAHGGTLPAAGIGPGPVAVYGPDGGFLALIEEEGGVARPLAVFVP